MKIKKISYLLPLMLMIAGCASPLKEIKHPELPFEKRHFSIRAPQDEGWGLQKETSESVLFGKIITKTHTVTAYIIEESAAPDFDSAEDFYTYYKITLSTNAYPDRYKLLKFEHAKDATYGDFSMRYVLTAEDHKAPNAPGNIPLIIKYKGYVIVLPEKYGLIAMFYSERGLAEEMLPDFEAKAEEFIQGFKIRVNGTYFTEHSAIDEEIKRNKK
jgi:hypothetical protein